VLILSLFLIIVLNFVFIAFAEEVDKELKIIPADEESNLEITPTLPEPGESLQNPTITKLKPVTIPVITPISVIP